MRYALQEAGQHTFQQKTAPVFVAAHKQPLPSDGAHAPEALVELVKVPAPSDGVHACEAVGLVKAPLAADGDHGN